MADVTDGPFPDSTAGVDRGQLFVAAALALATLLVALAVLMNAAIFTENLATRSGGGDVRNALESRSNVEANAAGLVRYANYHDNGSYADLDGAIRGSVRDYSVAAGAHGSLRGRGVNATLDSSTNGSRIVQDDTREFTSATNDDNWTLVSTARTRDLLLNVSALASEPGSAPRTAEDYRRSHVFQVVYADGGTEYQVFVYNASGDVGVRIALGDRANSKFDASAVERRKERARTAAARDDVRTTQPSRVVEDDATVSLWGFWLGRERRHVRSLRPDRRPATQRRWPVPLRRLRRCG